MVLLGCSGSGGRTQALAMPYAKARQKNVGGSSLVMGSSGRAVWQPLHKGMLGHLDSRSTQHRLLPSLVLGVFFRDQFLCKTGCNLASLWVHSNEQLGVDQGAAMPAETLPRWKPFQVRHGSGSHCQVAHHEIRRSNPCSGTAHARAVQSDRGGSSLVVESCDLVVWQPVCKCLPWHLDFSSFSSGPCRLLCLASSSETSPLARPAVTERAFGSGI